MLDDPSIDDEAIDDLLDQWEEARDAGKSIDIETLCKDQPNLIDEVRSRLAKLAAIDGRIGAGVTGLKPHDVTGTSLPIETVITDLRFLQSGGLGAVYVGEDSSTHRSVAVKFLHPHLAADPLCRQQFAMEAEVTSRLEHPGVIPMYGIGQSETGDPFYAMRFIDGMSMDEQIERLYRFENSEPKQRVEHDRRYRKLLTDFVSVCQTIAYAHNRGIVHRDIKPANVMLGKYGETIVVDWGLAVPVVRDEKFRRSGEATLMPASNKESSKNASSGLGAGTPAYMSPEQASKLSPTPASDIYSLGATLYKIVSGMPAVDGESIVEIKQKVIDGRIEPVSRVRSTVAKPLAAIVTKAMSLRPIDRYETALRMAEDVEAYLADESVSSYHEPFIGRVLRLARRHRSAAQTAILAITLGSILATFALLSLGAYATRETRLRRDAEAAKENAVEARTHADQLRKQSMALSAQFLAKSIANEIDLRWRILESEAASPKVREMMAAVNDKAAKGLLDPDRDDGGLLLSALDPGWTVLQSWVQNRFIKHQPAIKSDSWFAQGRSGYQFARAPMGNSVGRNYRHRDYFNGLGYDITIDELARQSKPIEPLVNRIVHMSAVYESTNTQTLKVTFSVPVHDREPERSSRKVIGIIGMSIELGDFAMDPNTWLVDTRPDQFNEQRGLVLQHPELGQRSGDDELPHLSKPLVQKLMELRQKRVEAVGRLDERGSPMVLQLDDPITGQTRTVAAEPVLIRGRPDRVADTGWIVIVTE